jgi:hypothetical protein
VSPLPRPILLQLLLLLLLLLATTCAATAAAAAAHQPGHQGHRYLVPAPPAADINTAVADRGSICALRPLLLLLRAEKSCQTGRPPLPLALPLLQAPATQGGAPVSLAASPRQARPRGRHSARLAPPLALRRVRTQPQAAQQRLRPPQAEATVGGAPRPRRRKGRSTADRLMAGMRGMRRRRRMMRGSSLLLHRPDGLPVQPQRPRPAPAVLVAGRRAAEPDHLPQPTD